MNNDSNNTWEHGITNLARAESRPLGGPVLARQSPPTGAAHSRGLLIINADDWGQSRLVTNKILECAMRGAISSTSAMVFMEDSERAATLARDRQIETGLHLNFTTPFSAPSCPAGLLEHQQRVATYLLRHRFAQVIFHPGLIQSFHYLVAAQLEEFRRLYGMEPEKIDGHHHMHLCANVLIQRLLPEGALVRRNFSVGKVKKSLWNRLYRKTVDRGLARRHRLVDFFFSLHPLEPSTRLQHVFSLAQQFAVELETHPVQSDEYRYLTEGHLFARLGNVPIVRPSAIPWAATNRVDHPRAMEI